MNLTPRLANYISRYAPSERKVIGYLEKKNCPNPRALLEESGYSESLMCDMWMRSFLALGKGKQEIRMKLMKKEFPKDMILEKLQSFDSEIQDWESNQSSIVRQIETLSTRGKSGRIIIATLLGKYPYFKDQITELLSEGDDKDNLEKEVQKYKNRYNTLDKKIQEKMIASLLRKGFRYSDIREYLK